MTQKMSLLPPSMTRREMLRLSGLGLGFLAQSYLLHSQGLLADDAGGVIPVGGNMLSRPPHFPAQAAEQDSAECEFFANCRQHGDVQEKLPSGHALRNHVLREPLE